MVKSLNSHKKLISLFSLAPSLLDRIEPGPLLFCRRSVLNRLLPSLLPFSHISYSIFWFYHTCLADVHHNQQRPKAFLLFLPVHSRSRTTHRLIRYTTCRTVGGFIFTSIGTSRSLRTSKRFRMEQGNSSRNHDQHDNSLCT